MTDLPTDIGEWIRMLNALTGCAAFGLLCYRLVGRWEAMSLLSRCVVSLLALSVLVLGLGAARAAMLSAPFNELAFAALVVNLGSCTVGLIWQRWLDPTGRRH